MLYPKFRRRSGVGPARPKVYTQRSGYAHPVVQEIEAGTGLRSFIRRRTLRASADEVRAGLAR